MPEHEDLVNTQIRDAVQFLNETTIGQAAAHSTGLIDTLMAETIGMAMYNAVNTQHNAQMIGSAAVAASCAKMLRSHAAPWMPPPVVPVNPVVTGVTPLTAGTSTFTASGTGFAAGLSVQIFQNGALLEQVSGSAISAVTATSFTWQSMALAAGTYTIQVLNINQGLSAPFSFTLA
jgi:hypothetical protein